MHGTPETAPSVKYYIKRINEAVENIDELLDRGALEDIKWGEPIDFISETDIRKYVEFLKSELNLLEDAYDEYLKDEKKEIDLNLWRELDKPAGHLIIDDWDEGYIAGLKRAKEYIDDNLPEWIQEQTDKLFDSEYDSEYDESECDSECESCEDCDGCESCKSCDSCDDCDDHDDFCFKPFSKMYFTWKCLDQFDPPEFDDDPDDPDDLDDLDDPDEPDESDDHDDPLAFNKMYFSIEVLDEDGNPIEEKPLYDEPIEVEASEEPVITEDRVREITVETLTELLDREFSDDVNFTYKIEPALTPLQKAMESDEPEERKKGFEYYFGKPIKDITEVDSSEDNNNDDLQDMPMVEGLKKCDGCPVCDFCNNKEEVDEPLELTLGAWKAYVEGRDYTEEGQED